MQRRRTLVFRSLLIMTILFMAQLCSGQVFYNVVPQNRSLIPRNIQSGLADAKIEINIKGTSYNRARIRCLQNQKAFYDQSLNLIFNSGVATISQIIKIKAGKFRYDFTIELFGKDTLVKKITDVVAGDAYIIQGQSNAVANAYNGLANPGYRDSFIRSFGSSTTTPSLSQTDTQWYIANGDGFYNKGCIGQWGLVMAKMLLDSFGIPIAIMNGAVGGTSVSYHQRYNPQPDNLNTCYGRLLTRMRKAGLDKKLRGILWFQGESDGQFPRFHDSLFRILYADWAKDYKGIQQNYIVQVRGGGCGGPTAPMLELQRQFEFSLNKAKVISTNGLNGHDGCHYAFVNGYQLLGIQLAALLGRDLYGSARKTQIDPPNISSAVYSNADRSEITLHMRQPEDSIFIDPGFYKLFYLTGDNSISITGGFIRNNQVVLTLSKGTCLPIKLTYMGQAGVQPWVKNKTKSGLIGFHALPIVLPSIKTTYNGCKSSTLILGEDSIAGCKYQWIRSSDKITFTTAKIKQKLNANEVYTFIRIFKSPGCQYDTNQVSLTVDPTPFINLAGNRVACSGDTVSLFSTNTYEQIVWSKNGDLSIDKELKVWESAFISVKATSFYGCLSKDSINLSFKKPTVHIGPDIAICPGTDTLITATPGWVSYTWNSVFSASNTKRFGAGEIVVTVKDSWGCKASDTAVISAFEKSIFVHPGEQICPYDSVQIFKPLNAVSWTLFGKPLTSSFYFQPGKYNVSCLDINNCPFEGEIVVKSSPLPAFNLGKDTAVCPGQFVTIHCDYYSQNYVWNGSKQPVSYFKTKLAELVVCEVLNSDGCIYRDSVNILHFDEPIFKFPSDTTLCYGDIWVPNLPKQYQYFLNGEKVAIPEIKLPGNYLIRAINNKGCSLVKETQVSTKNCINLVQDFAKNNMAISPNPVDNYVNVSPEMVEIQFFQLNGQLIYSSPILIKGCMAVDFLQPGIYIVKTALGSAFMVKK